MDQGIIDVAPSNYAYLADANENDLIIVSTDPGFNVRFGAGLESDSTMLVKNDRVIFNKRVSFSNPTGETSLYSSQTYLGILQSSPEYNLDVNGTVNIASQLYHNGVLSRGMQYNVNGDIFWMSNVGIGKTDPAYKLDVSGSINSTNLYTNGIQRRPFKAGVSDYAFYDSRVGISTNNPAYHLDVNGDLNMQNLYQRGTLSKSPYIGSNAFYFDSNVGINTSNPDYDLEVNGDVNISGILYQDGQSSKAFFRGSTGSTIYYMDRVGISNTNPQYSLDVGDSLNVKSGFYQDGTLSKAFYTSSTPANAIYYPDNVGIGVSTPSFRLHVNGSFNASGTMYQNGTELGLLFKGPGASIYTTDDMGVGTVAPSHKLHVVGTTGIQGNLIVADTLGSGVYGNILFGAVDSGIGLSRDVANVIVRSVGDTILRTDTKDGLYVQAATANVIIGESGDSAKLNVASNVAATFNAVSLRNFSTDTSASVNARILNGNNEGLTLSVGISTPPTIQSSQGDLKLATGSTFMQLNTNVGINTSTPAEKVDIYGGNLCVNNASLITKHSTYDAMLSIAQSSAQFSADARVGDVVLSSTSNSRILIQTDRLLGSAICIDSNDIGIGTDAPVSKLHVSGDAAITNGKLVLAADSNLASGGSLQFGSTNCLLFRNTTTGTLTACNNTTVAFMPSTGVSINKPDASYMLDVRANTVRIEGSSAAGGKIRCENSTSSIHGNFGVDPLENASSALGMSTTTATHLVLGTNATERVRITSSGNIGINNMTPNAPLEFTPNAAPRKLVLADSNNNDNQFYGFGTDASSLQYRVPATSADHIFYAATSTINSTEVLRIRGTGRVGVTCIQPTAQVQIADNFGLSNNIVFQVQQSTGNATINFNGYTDPQTQCNIAIDTAKTSWKIKCDQYNTDSLSIEQFYPNLTDSNVYRYMHMENSNITMSQFVKITAPYYTEGSVSLLTSTSQYDLSGMDYLLSLSLDSAYKPGSSTWDSASDSRIKENIQPADIDACYNIVEKLPLKTFYLKEPQSGIVSKEKRTGWIAQEVEEYIPEAVKVRKAHGFDDFRTLSADNVYATMYGCIQKMQQIIKTLEKRVADLEEKEKNA